jgi:hypothetical protein
VAKKVKNQLGLAENQGVFGLAGYESVLGTVENSLPDGRKMTFGERFQYALRTLPVKQREKALGRTDKMLRGYTDDRVALGVVTALAVASKIPAPWIIFGEAAPALPEYAMVPGLSVRASAGAGALVAPDEPLADVVAFRKDWLSRLGINPRFARAIFARGDSMEPTINDGDLLLVDESIQHIVDHGIYVVVYQGMVIVKRVQLRRDGTLVLKSDNPRYEAEEVPKAEIDQIQVAGRVRWFGRTI